MIVRMVFRGCVLRENVLIGEGSTVGKNSSIANSSIGKNVTIGTSILPYKFFIAFRSHLETVCCFPGDNVVIDGAYIWDNCTINNGCRLERCVIDCNVELAENVNVKSGCVIGQNVSKINSPSQ